MPNPWRFVRSLLAGAAATLVDLAVLEALVLLFHASPRAANVPALVAGGLVAFVGNRHFAFRAGDGPLARHVLGYAAVEIAALALNGILFDLAMRAMPGHPERCALVRLVTSHVVFLAWSYPLWRVVFRGGRSTVPTG